MKILKKKKKINNNNTKTKHPTCLNLQELNKGFKQTCVVWSLEHSTCKKPAAPHIFDPDQVLNDVKKILSDQSSIASSHSPAMGCSILGITDHSPVQNRTFSNITVISL